MQFLPCCLVSTTGTITVVHGFVSGRGLHANLKRPSTLSCPNFLINNLPSFTELYSQIKIGTGTSDTAAFKSDATFFTIAA